MKKIDRILKQLGDLYEFNQRIKSYALKKREATNRVAEGLSPPTHHNKPRINMNGDGKVGRS